MKKKTPVPVDARAVTKSDGDGGDGDVDSVTPLHLAVYHNRPEAVRVLLKINADTSESGRSCACVCVPVGTPDGTLFKS